MSGRRCCAPSSWYTLPGPLQDPGEAPGKGSASSPAATPPLRCSALGFFFELVCEDDALAGATKLLFTDLESADEVLHRLVVTNEQNGLHVIVADNRIAASELISSEVLPMLSWLVNQGAIHHPADNLLFHAAVLAWGDDGVVAPGVSGSGKSTLAAALLAAGLSYLSDEVGALDPETLRLHAYPKPLSLGTASLRLLALEGRVPAEVRAVSEDGSCLIPAAAIRAGGVRPSCAPRLAIFPTLAPGTTSKLRPLPRSEAMSRFVTNSFNFGERPAAHFEACAELCRRVESYELAIGEPVAAARLVRTCLAGVRGGAAEDAGVPSPSQLPSPTQLAQR